MKFFTKKSKSLLLFSKNILTLSFISFMCFWCSLCCIFVKSVYHSKVCKNESTCKITLFSNELFSVHASWTVLRWIISTNVWYWNIYECGLVLVRYKTGSLQNYTCTCTCMFVLIIVRCHFLQDIIQNEWK